jgi:hypothetical protein
MVEGTKQRPHAADEQCWLGDGQANDELPNQPTAKKDRPH